MNSPQNVKVNCNCRHAWYASWRMGALVPLLAVYAVSAVAFALDPPPTGGYLNEVTALGEGALFGKSTGGLEATALGYQALYNNTTGSQTRRSVLSVYTVTALVHRTSPLEAIRCTATPPALITQGSV